VRYRYYVSQAVLPGKPPPPGLVSRVPAPEIEALVVAALRKHLNASGAGEPLPDNNRDLPRAPSRACDLDPPTISSFGCARASMLRKATTPLDPAELAQPLHKSGEPLALTGRRARAQVSDGRQLAASRHSRRAAGVADTAADG
jgi:hypothetical protein